MKDQGEKTNLFKIKKEQMLGIFQKTDFSNTKYDVWYEIRLVFKKITNYSCFFLNLKSWKENRENILAWETISKLCIISNETLWK